MSKICSLIAGLVPSYLHSIEQTVEIDKNKDKPLRYNVWNTTVDHVKGLFSDKGMKVLPTETAGNGNSPQVLKKIENALSRLTSSKAYKYTAEFRDLLFGDAANNDSIALSIAMHEVMEAVKGESDKAGNYGVDISSITKDGRLPVLPLSRVAAIIGRKIVFQSGHRFKSSGDYDRVTAEHIETLYYGAGKLALEKLARLGYVDINEDLPSIKDYLNADELKADYVKQNVATKAGSHVPTVSINEKALGVDDKTENYFLNRTLYDANDTKLGAIADIMNAVKQITQPATIVLTDQNARLTKEDLRELDDQNMVPDPITDRAREQLYKNPVFVNKSVHGLMTLLNERVLATGESASKILQDNFGKSHSGLIESLFGIKRSDEHSRDKTESVSGQNLSRTTPFNDTAENYNILQGDNTDPAPQHIPMKQGRNVRLYCHNSVLNPHGSKHSRYSITTGEQEVEVGSGHYDAIVFGVSEALGGKLSYDHITGETNSSLNASIKLFESYKKYIAKGDLNIAIGELSKIAVKFPGVDYASILTGMQAVVDIRDAKDGVLKTEFPVTADATASGGTQTFVQALGTSPEVTAFLEDLGMLKDADGNVEVTIDDLYKIMQNSIEDFIAGESIPGLTGQVLPDDPTADPTGMRLLMAKTVELLFDNGEKLRDLSKDPTMVFVYKQGEAGAISTMANSLADRIIDNMEQPAVRKYMAMLLDDVDYETIPTAKLNATEGLYGQIVEAIEDQGLPQQMYDILDASINKQYLSSFNERADAVYKLVEELDVDFKILPAGAVLAGIEPTAENIEKYGMPISKVHEVAHTVEGTGDVVLTREHKGSKAVAEVSTIHGVDSAQLYHALERVMSRPEFKGEGAVVVHDEVRGSAKLVEAVTAEYKAVSKDIANAYDVHEQIMLSIAAQSPEIAATPEYKTLMAKIDSNVKEKMKILKDSFNDDTDSLIGDNAKVKEFSGKSKTRPTPAKAPEIAKAVKEGMDQNTQNSKILNVVKELAGESEIITRFISNVKNLARIRKGDTENTYLPDVDQVEITGTDIGRGAGDKLDINDKADRQKQKELIEHEIVHASTVAYLISAFDNENSAAGREVKYFTKTVAKLKDIIETAGFADFMNEDKFPGETLDRIRYIVGRKNDVDRVSELVAIMETEPETAQAIYKLLAGENASKQLKDRIKAFIKKVVNSFTGISNEDLTKDIDVEKLFGAIRNTVETGTNQREQDYEATKKVRETYNGKLGAGPKAADVIALGSINYLNQAIASMISTRIEAKGASIFGNVNEFLKEKFPKYVEVVDKLNGIYDSSGDLQQLVHTITGEGANKGRKADLLAMSTKILSQQVSSANEQQGLFNKALKPLSAEFKKTVGRFVTEMPLHDYFTLASEFKTAAAIASEVTRLEKQFKKNKDVIKDVDGLIEWNVKHTAEYAGGIYNLEAKYPTSSESDFGTDVRKLLALKSIQTIGSKDFEAFLENTELSDLVRDSSMANRLSVLFNNGTAGLNGSFVHEYHKEPVITEVIELSDLHRYETGEATGWKLLRAPTKDSLGVIYKEIIDSSNVNGAFTDTKLGSTDIDVTGSKAKYKGLAITPDDGRKLQLTQKEKATIGIIDDFSHSLVQSTAHNMAVQDSQIIRDEIIKKEVRYTVGKDASGLVDRIAAKNVENPWFVKFEGTSWEEMPKEVKARYKKVGNRVSNVKNFHNEIHMVRKDISHWLLGGSSSSLFQNPQYKWMARITKDLVAGAKIGMVVLNPVKIAIDNMSNVSYLGISGVSPAFIITNYKEITEEYKKYAELKREAIKLKVQMVARPESKKLQDKLKGIQKKINRTGLGDLEDKGFISSLGSDLVSKNADTISGLQGDMHKALSYLLTEKDGKKNYVSHFILQLNKLGYDGESFIKYLSNVSSKGKGNAELDRIHDRLKEIRTDEDVINYVAQFTTSPGSEAVRVGASLTDLTDVLAKETLYRHLVQNEGMDPEAAKIKVLDSFPDYKENMPLAVKTQSDYGILMFPSYWLRIQKAIYSAVKGKPINVATEALIEEAVGSNIPTIFDANIINKATSFGGIFHTPTESMGVGSVVPMHLF